MPNESVALEILDEFKVPNFDFDQYWLKWDPMQIEWFIKNNNLRIQNPRQWWDDIYGEIITDLWRTNVYPKQITFDNFETRYAVNYNFEIGSNWFREGISYRKNVNDGRESLTVDDVVIRNTSGNTSMDDFGIYAEWAYKNWVDPDIMKLIKFINPDTEIFN